MSELLKKHQKKEFLYESKDFKLCAPTDFQREELIGMVIEKSKIENEELISEFDLKSIRYILRELTNIGSEIDEVSDKEMESLLDNGDREIQLLMREIEKLLGEIAEDVIYMTTKGIKFMNDSLNAIDTNGDMEKLKKKWNKLNKKYKMNMSWEELIEISNKREELENKIGKIK